MNASFRRLHVTLGSIALIALAAGCAGEKRQSAEPAQPVGRTPAGRTPTFESQMPYDTNGQPPSDRGQAPVPDRRAPGTSPAEPRGQYGTPTPPRVGRSGGPGAPGARPGQPRGGGPGAPGAPPGQPGGGAAGMGMMDERQICDEISENAVLSVDNIPGGVQILMTPKPGADTASLQQLARQIDRHMSEQAQEEQQANGAASRCPLFDLSRIGGSRGRVVEAADGVRILFTSEDTAGVSTLRDRARSFVQSTDQSTDSGQMP